MGRAATVVAVLFLGCGGMPEPGPMQLLGGPLPDAAADSTSGVDSAVDARADGPMSQVDGAPDSSMPDAMMTTDAMPETCNTDNAPCCRNGSGLLYCTNWTTCISGACKPCGAHGQICCVNVGSSDFCRDDPQGRACIGPAMNGRSTCI